MINQEIEDIFVKSLLKSGIVKSKDFEFVGVKGLSKRKQKLLQYLDKKGEFDIETALFELKDLLRGSIITDSYDHTEKVFNAIANLSLTKVVQVKNE